MANESVTSETAFHVRHVPGGELFKVNPGIPTEQAEQFASYLLRFVNDRMWELGDTKPMAEEFTVHHFLLMTIDALRSASQAEEPRQALNSAG